MEKNEKTEKIRLNKIQNIKDNLESIKYLLDNYEHRFNDIENLHEIDNTILSIFLSIAKKTEV